MLVFIDESGIQKREGHSTTAVVYVEVSRKDEFDRELLKVEKDLRITSFHWADERWYMREKFIERIADLNFRFKVAVFKNPVNPEKMIEAVFRQLLTETNIRKVLIDGKKPRWYELRLKKALRDRGVAVKKLKNEKSPANAGPVDPASLSCDELFPTREFVAGNLLYEYYNSKRKCLWWHFNAAIRMRIEGRSDKISGIGAYWSAGRVNAAAAVAP